ncbi:VWA domain-containing protein [Falsihalocynthiibacter arcticus]|uniref:VWFA domain-containing protein n=1 Tax=Falsihalocynthiibacter arcticus TaxID=1579316 RepID=A0A126UYJ1_9RHOB|nr:VWA domain-containing protein [Falsihalocynthiibacter arcticus]AML51123.1 hypothetical protein RC74_07465 [Falsihalocynthiibacter arcticus]
MLSFALPLAFLLLPIPLLVWKFAPPYQERSSALRVPFFRSMAQAVDMPHSSGAIVRSHTKLQFIASALVWVLMVIGLAQPEKLGDPITIETSARDVVLAVDISGSMDERDLIGPDGKPLQRLDAVKQVVGDFIAEREGDRIALIVFGSDAYLQVPFTEDLETAAEILDQTQVGMAGPHTAIGDAIGLALNTFQGSDVDQKLVILLSDGADTNSRMSPINAADIAARQGVSIYTIGIGKEDGEGEARVDTDALIQIADRANGQFYFADDSEGLREIYDTIDALNPRVIDSAEFQPREPLSQIPFGVALCLTLSALLWLVFTAKRKQKNA